jgi:hypothetical protein
VNSRAWVCQERLLSPRIIHFGEGQLFWECNELKASEGFPGGIPTRYETSTQRDLLYSITTQQEQNEYLKVWDSIVRRYTAGSLSYPSDKLIAVSALAKQISMTLPATEEYMAGLWKSNLIDQLLWVPAPTAARSRHYRAPSWSWACMDGPISANFNWPRYGSQGGKMHSLKLATILEATVEHGANPYDSVKSGILRLSAPLLRVKLTADQKYKTERTIFREETRSSMEIGINIKGGAISVNESAQEKREQQLGEREYYVPFPDTHKARAWLDEDYDVSTARNFFFLPLSSFYEADGFIGEIEISTIEGLIVEPTKAQKGQFRRVGTCQLDGYASGEFFCALGNQERDELEYEAIAEEMLPLDAFVPERFSGKLVDFFPKEYECYVVSVI